MPYVDLAFKLTGSKAPVDHGCIIFRNKPDWERGLSSPYLEKKVACPPVSLQ